MSNSENDKIRTRSVSSEIELLLSEAASGIPLARKTSEDLRRVLGNPFAFVTEAEWAEIQEVSELPVAARFEINAVLRRYWNALIDETIDPNIGVQLRSTIKSVEALIVDLNTLDLHADIAKKTTSEEIADLDQLTKTCDALADCYHVLARAEERLYRGRGRTGYGPLIPLIGDLDKVLMEFTGSHLTLSSNRMEHGGHTPEDYVWAVCKIAHLKVTKATIRTRLAEYLRQRDAHTID